MHETADTIIQRDACRPSDDPPGERPLQRYHGWILWRPEVRAHCTFPCNALSRYTGVRLVFISPEELKIPHYIKTDIVERNHMPYEETYTMETVMPQLDILYMTRVQGERFFNEADYIRLRDYYILTPDKLTNAKKDLCILHPLPRVNEISRSIDSDPRACYFKQVENGKYMRMALIMMLLGLTP